MMGRKIIYSKIAEAGLNAEWAAEIMNALNKAGLIIVEKNYVAAKIAAHAQQFMIDTEDR